MIEAGLRTLLLAQSSITALVPTQTVRDNTVEAIVVDAPPQALELPYIVINQVAEDGMLCLDGTYGMQSTEVEIDCTASTPAKAQAIAAAVRTFLDDYTGTAGSSTIDAVLYLGRAFTRVQRTDGRDVRDCIVSLSYQVQHH